MLQSIRDKTHGWIAGIIISLLILSFALWGIHSYLGGSVSDVVAKVNGVEISQSQLSVAYERLRRQLELQKADMTLLAGAEANVKEQALQSLINLQVLKQASLKQDYRISEAQVEGYLENMPDFKVGGQFSLSRFQQILNATLFTTKDFLDLVKTTLLIDQPRLGVIFSSFSLPNEVSESINLINQERDIQYTLLPLTLFPKQSIVIHEDTIQKYYESHLNDFQKPELISIEYILVSAKNLMSKLEPTDAELKNYYNENTDSFNTPAKWKFVSIAVPFDANAAAENIKQVETKANDVYQKLEQGKDATAVAQEFAIKNNHIISHDYVALNELPQNIQNDLLSATQAGQVIKPIKQNNEFIIIKVLDYKKPEHQSFDKVKDEVKEAIVLPKAEEEFANIKDKLANITYEHPDSLKSASDVLNLPIQTTELFSKDKGNGGITDNAKVRESAFSSDVLDAKNNSDVIPLNADSVIVLRVKSHSAAASLPLSEVKQQIVDKLQATEADNQAMKHANEILSKLQSGVSPEEVAKAYSLQWSRSGLISRHSTKIDSAILDVAFDLPPPVSEKSYAIAKVPNGYVIVGLKSVQAGILPRSDDYDAFSEQVQNTQGLLEYELYKQSLMKQAKIVVENQQ